MSEEKIIINKLLKDKKNYVNVDFKGDHNTLVSMIYTAMHGNIKISDAIIEACGRFTMDIIMEERQARLN